MFSKENGTAQTTISGWGDNTYGQITAPATAFGVTNISAGAYHSLALRANGSVIAWGRGTEGQTNVPVGLSNVIAIAAGGYHNLALRDDATVVAWGAGSSNYSGLYNFGQAIVPPGLSNVTAIAAGARHSLALRKDGTVVAWGDNEYGQTNVPPGLTNVAAIAAGDGYHSLALRQDGTVVAWGWNNHGQTNVPGGLGAVEMPDPNKLFQTVIFLPGTIAAGGYHSLALMADGTVAGWGTNVFGAATPPPGLVNAYSIAAGYSHSLAIQSDSTVAAWGDNTYGQTSVPAGLRNVVAIAGGERHSLALSSCAPFIQNLTMTRSIQPNGILLTFCATVQGQSPLSYSWTTNAGSYGSASTTSGCFSWLVSPTDDYSSPYLGLAVENPCGRDVVGAFFDTCAICLSRGAPSVLTGGNGSGGGPPLTNTCEVLSSYARWFKLIATNGNGYVSVSSEGSSSDTRLAIYTGPISYPDQLALVTCTNGTSPSDRQSQVTFKATEKTVYWLVADPRTNATGLRLSAALGQTLTVSGITANNKVYDGSTAATINTSTALLNGVLPGDVGNVTLVTSGAAGTFADKNVGVSKTVNISGLTLSGSAAGNYTLTQPTTMASITPARLTVTANDASRAYGSANPTFAAVISGFVNGETAAVVSGAASLSTTATAASPVGSYAITPSLGSLSAANYTFANVNGTLSVTPASLMITADNKTKVYGAPLPVLTASYNGFVNGDTAASLTTPPTLSTLATAVSPVGNYDITVSGTVDANYTITYAKGTLTVGAAPLTVTATDASRTYGSANPAFSANITGFVNGDAVAVVSGTPSLSTTATVNSPVGPYPITPTLGNLSAANYRFANFVNGTLSVTPASLMITADNKTKVYGAPLPVLTASYSGFVNGDSAASLTTPPTLSTLATAASAVGNYDITVSGAVNANYAITYAKGTLTVQAAPLTVTATDASRTYGSANPAFSANITGFVNGDTLAVVSGTPSLSTTATVNSPVGRYRITPTLGNLSAANYSFANFVNGTLSVTPASLMITADNKTKVYGAPLPVLTASYNGFVNGDTAGSLTTPPTLSTLATTASPVGNYDITVSGAVDANYAIAYAKGSLTLGGAALTVTANNASRAYGSANPTFTAVISGFVNGDTAAVVSGAASLGTTATAASPVGSYAITPSLGSLSAANYTFPNFVNGTLTVGGAPLTVTANNASRAYGSANPTFTAGISGFVNGDTAAVVSGAASLSTTSTAASPVGSYAITPSLGSLSAANYTFANFVNGTLSVTPVLLTVRAGDTNRPYGAANPPFSASYSGFANGDTITALQGGPTFTTSATPTSPPGSYAIVVAQGTLTAQDYNFTFINGTLTVTSDLLNTIQITWTANSGLALSMQGIAGSLYQVQVSNDLVNWTLLTNVTADATGSVRVLIPISTRGGDVSFYRVLSR